MSVGDLPNEDQESYNAMMEAADDFVENASFNAANVQRQPSDCDKLAALIAAAQTLYSQICPIA